ncbi:MAG TPA: DUF4097 family beta strand repeat-containing protein [Bacteroidota bacterium]|nr:DUF4097 family beta strand repeat-containing protein [Bacteroidota bacterium]
MNASQSMAGKLIVLVLFAVGFGVVLVTLSARETKGTAFHSHMYGTPHTIEKKYTVQPGGLLSVDADEGDVTITGSEGTEAEITVTMRGDAERLDNYHVDINQDGNTIKIEGKEDRNFFHHWNGSNMEVHFDIKLPKKFDLDLQTAGGDITLNDMNGKLDGKTSGGDLELTGISGTVDMRTSGGNVKVHNGDGDLTLRTSGGNIRGDKVTGIFDVETSGGNIDLMNVDAKLNASTSGGEIEVELVSNKGVSLSTSGGNVRVRMEKSLAADIEAETYGGDVNCDLEYSGKIKDGSMNGKLNGGGALIRAKTSGGDITFTSKF